MLQVEFEFTLPNGYLDPRGDLHREGAMRLGTVRDELEALHDPRCKASADFLPVVTLSRVVTRLGTINKISPDVILDLFSQDYQFLQDLYIRLNAPEEATEPGEVIETVCPQCGAEIVIDLDEEL